MTGFFISGKNKPRRGGVYSVQQAGLLLVVDVHRDFEAEADVIVSRGFPLHDSSPG